MSALRVTGSLKQALFVVLLTVLVSSSYFVLREEAHAQVSAPAGSATMTAVTADTNNDGTIDKMTITFSRAVTIKQTDTTDDMHSLVLSDGCNVPNGNYASSNTTTLTLSGLTGCTAGNTALMPTVTYTAVTNCSSEYAICSVLGGVQVGSGQVAAVTDGAAPIMTAAKIRQTTIDGVTYNSVRLSYSEPITVTNGTVGFGAASSYTSSATLGAMTSARTFAGIATWGTTSGGNMKGSAATNNSVVVDNAASPASLTVVLNTDPSGYFTSGTTAPTGAVFTAVSDAADVKDMAGNAVNVSAAPVTATVTTAWDVVAPTVTTTYSCDSDEDGDVDRFQLNFNENILDAGTPAAGFEGDNDSTNDGVGEETANEFFTGTGGCDGNALDTDANDDKIRIGLATGIPGTELAYVHVGASGGRDHAGNRMVYGTAIGTETDKARPVLMSNTPSNGASGVLASSAITLTFSESITSLSAELNPPSPLTVQTTLPAKTLELASSSKVAGVNTLTVTTAPDSAGNNFESLGIATAHPFSFTVGTTTTTTPSATDWITLSAPNGGTSYTVGSNVNIVWSAGSAITVARALYSTDGGSNYTVIASGLAGGNGSYAWTVPNALTTTARVKIEGYAGSMLAAADTSNAYFSIVSSTTTTTPTNAPTTGGTGISPVTGLVEPLSSVGVGDYVRGASFSTVYYVDVGNVRRPFMDLQTFRTYQSSFGNVRIVTDATLPTMSLGQPMLPKSGVVLVKITSVNKVYALEAGTDGSTQLRWITTEGVAEANYGSYWADYVIDIPPTLFTKFTAGADIISDENPNLSIMQTRVNLNK